MSEDQLIDFTEIWDPWIQSWRFSNHAVFRIPEYLASMWGDWHQQSPLLIQEKFEPEPFFYFRHPLTDMVTKPKGWTSKMQFAQSALLTKMLSARNVPNGIGKLEEQLKANAKIVLGSIKNFVNTLNEKQGKSKEWEEFILAIQEKRGSNYLEKEIDFDLLRSLPSKSINVDKAPEILHHLILAFCSVDFRGYVQQRLNEKHLAFSAKEREEIVGYCIQLLPEPDAKKLPRIEWMRVLHWDGSSKNLVLNKKEKDQLSPYNILGVNKDTEFAPLLLAMFSAVNGPLALRSQVTQRLVAVPVYEWSAAATGINGDSPDPTRRHRGGALLGWVLNRFPNPVDPADERDLVDKIGWNSLFGSSEGKPLPFLREHVKTLSLLAETFASKYMSGDTEWALERKWEPEDTAKTYMECYFHDSCSWRCSFDNLLEEDLHKVRESYFHPLKDEKGRLLINLSKSASPNDPSGPDQPVIAVLTPTVHNLNLKTDKSVEDKYFNSVAEHARYFYRDRALPIEIQREALRKLGQSKAFHDYSKDLNVLEDQLYRYTKDANAVRQEIEREAEELLKVESIPEPVRDAVQRVREQARKLGEPNFDYMLRLQFLMSHLRVKTEGRLYEAPEFAWRWLESGTRWDIYLILRALVWRPFGWRWYDDKLKTLPESVLDDDAMTWTRLLLFDEDREESKPRTVTHRARQGISQVFHKLFFEWNISQTDYEASFLPPAVNPKVGWQERILWNKEADSKAHHLRWLPPVRLLPVFVFAMRTAFEHAFLRNLLNVLNADSPAAIKGQKPRTIRLRESTGPHPGGARIHHRIHIAFPALGLEKNLKPLAAGAREPATLPYDNWSRHIDHYRYVSRPWYWQVERVGGSLEPENLPYDTFHYEFTLEARE